MKIFSQILIFVFFGSLLGSQLALAQRRSYTPAKPPQWTWDLGAAFGSYGNYSYTEIDLGVNDRFSDSFNWRNVLWDRFGNSTISALGVDSSLRYELNDRTDSGGSGFRFFIGPGVRVASSQYSGVFGEAGAIFRLGGLSLGGGVKVLNYFSPGKDPATNLTLPGTDVMYFIILAGGGTL